MSERLVIEPLTPEAFAPFGEVIAPEAARRVFPINGGNTQRFHDLAAVECEGDGARVGISLFRGQPRTMPFTVTMLERHPLGSQAFVPLSRTPYLIVVSTSPDATPRAFFARDGQGVNYRRGTWHHPLLALDAVSDFLVVDRIGPGNNCEEATLMQAWLLDP